MIGEVAKLRAFIEAECARLPADRQSPVATCDRLCVQEPDLYAAILSELHCYSLTLVLVTVPTILCVPPAERQWFQGVVRELWLRSSEKRAHDAA
jgi:hypothetical protein